jgi:mRNA interferase RelE/StbE
VKPVKIVYSRDALKFLNEQTKRSVARIREAIAKLTLNPPEGDIALMRGYSDGRKRLRIGPWRIIFKNTTENQIEILLIIDIGNRGDIYK